MTVAERVAELLAGVCIEDQIRGREVEDAARLLGYSAAHTYRLVAAGEIGHVKMDGCARKGKGRAGSVRIRLLDVVKFMVEREIVPGAKKAARS